MSVERYGTRFCDDDATTRVPVVYILESMVSRLPAACSPSHVLRTIPRSPCAACAPCIDSPTPTPTPTPTTINADKVEISLPEALRSRFTRAALAVVGAQVYESQCGRLTWRLGLSSERIRFRLKAHR
jgi:hypothetical protein